MFIFVQKNGKHFLIQNTIEIWISLNNIILFLFAFEKSKYIVDSIIHGLDYVVTNMFQSFCLIDIWDTFWLDSLGKKKL